MDITSLSLLNSTMSSAVSTGERKVNGAASIKEAAGEFEALLVKQMLDAMRKTVKKTDLFGSTMNNNYFEDLMYHQYAKSISNTAKLGVAEMIAKAYE
ncbi:MAG: rod-binding protein [Spirochaetia bacterium]